jgi:4a-hydroxytetrahydrobiopterin dehydratase
VTRPARLERSVVTDWLAGHVSWRLDDGHLVRDLVTVDYPTTALIVSAQVDLAQRLDHHPNITVGYRTVSIEMWTHDQDDITQLDLDYCEGFDAIIAELFAGAVD